MKDVNVREVRNRLQHGDLAQINAITGISVRRISEVLNKGRNSGGCRDAVLGAAMDILKNKGVGRELLISKAEDLKLTTADTIPIPYRSKRKGKIFKGSQRKTNPLLYVAGGIVVLGLLFGKKLLAKIQ